MAVTMPEDISQDPVQSEVWECLAPAGNGFSEQDVPTLRLLCYWHAVARQAEESMRAPDGRIAIYDKIGVKPYKTPDGKSVPMMRKSPAIAVLKEASSEIRMLSELLGIGSGGREQQAQPSPDGKGRLLQVVFSDRQAKEKAAEA